MPSPLKRKYHCTTINSFWLFLLYPQKCPCLPDPLPPLLVKNCFPLNYGQHFVFYHDDGNSVLTRFQLRTISVKSASAQPVFWNSPKKIVQLILLRQDRPNFGRHFGFFEPKKRRKMLVRVGARTFFFRHLHEIPISKKIIVQRKFAPTRQFCINSC